MMQRFNVFFTIFFSLLLISCSDHKIDSDVISNGSTMSAEAREAEKNLDKASYADIADIFLDTNEISFDKNILIIFGKNNCQYCDMLKDMIKRNEGYSEITLPAQELIKKINDL